MGNPIDKYRQNAVLEGAGAGSGYKSEGYAKPAILIGAGGAGLMAGPIKLASMTGEKAAAAKQREREAADEIKREKRGVEKNSTDRARDDAREMKMQEQTDKAADMASKNMAKGGTASSRADGGCVKGKTRGKVC
jgi:hypothetical protein